MFPYIYYRSSRGEAVQISIECHLSDHVLNSLYSLQMNSVWEMKGRENGKKQASERDE